MAKADIGPKIGIEGEAQFRKELQQINQGMKVLESESKAVAAAMENETDAEKKSAAQKDVLNRRILAQKEQLEKLEQGLSASAKKYGEADTRTMKWQKSVYDAQAALSKMENQLAGTDREVEDLAGDLDEAEQATAGWADVMKGSLLADAVKAGLQKIVDLGKGAAEAFKAASIEGAAYADTILTLSSTSGLDTDTLQTFTYMADLVDVSVDTVTGALTKLTSNMSKAKAGTGDAAEAFREMGVAILDGKGELRKAEDVLNDALTALGKVSNETERDALAMKIFGKSAKDLNPLIDAGADRLKGLAKEAKDTGYVLSGAALDALGRQQDAMDRLNKKTEAVRNNFAVNLAPAMERAYNVMGEALDNPRVQRGLSLLSSGISSVIDGVSGLAAKALPQLINLLSPFDDQLKYLTDDQIALFQAVDDSKKAHAEMVDSFRTSAQGIIDETRRTEGLWKELQTLVDENGNVKQKDEERVNYINSELKEALGVQMELENGILKGYKDQAKEIDNLIKKREAEALLDAGADKFAKAAAMKEEATQRAAKLYPEVESALRKAERAQRDYAKAINWADSHFDGTEEGETKRLRYLESYKHNVEEARAAYELLAAKYDEASENEAEYYATAGKWQRAQQAAANERYDEVVRILTDEFGATLEYYKQKKKLSDQDKRDLEQKLKDQELIVAEYKRKLAKGLTDFSDAGLRELQSYVEEARQILDGKKIAEYFVDGLVEGLLSKGKLKELERAATGTARTIYDKAKNELRIASPSKSAVWIGEMWDAGLIKGLEERETELAKAAQRLAATITEGSTPAGIGPSYSYGNAVMASPITPYASSASSYTTNLGGIVMHIDAAGVDNVEQLAEIVTEKLTDTLNRANRGGRL